MTERFIGPSTQPELKTLLDQVQRKTMLSMNCVQIGIIQEYRAATNTAKVKIATQIQLPTGKVLDYPILDDCPVFTLSGGTSFVSCPISVGDNCLILFNDRNIDNWYLSGIVTTPASPRLHNIADGIVLVGINPISSPKATPLNSVCVNGGSKKVSIKNSATDLRTVLLDLITAISQITVTVDGAPLSINNIAAFTAPIVGIADKLKTLLDEGAI